MVGHFRTPPSRKRDVRFLWGGDTAGQGWGINPDFGGMKIYKTMLDDTFGPKVVFQKAPPAGQSNPAPSAGYQFFGQVDLDPHAGDLVVSLRDLNGTIVFSQRLEAHGHD